MRALTAGVRLKEADSPAALGPSYVAGTLGAEVQVSIDLDSGYGRLGTAVVEFRAGQLTALAPDAPGGIGQEKPPGIDEDDNGGIGPPSPADAHGREAGDGPARKKKKSSS